MAPVANQTLPEYIETIGDEAASILFGVEKRTAQSWRLRTRLPRPEQADVIVKKSPVTWEGIYGPKARATA